MTGAVYETKSGSKYSLREDGLLVKNGEPVDFSLPIFPTGEPACTEEIEYFGIRVRDRKEMKRDPDGWIRDLGIAKGFKRVGFDEIKGELGNPDELHVCIVGLTKENARELRERLGLPETASLDEIAERLEPTEKMLPYFATSSIVGYETSSSN